MDFIRKALYILFFVFLLIPQTYSQSVGLVLSGGGAKGMTHIGLIRALEENNIPIDYITGTSRGLSSVLFTLWDILRTIWRNF